MLLAISKEPLLKYCRLKLPSFKKSEFTQLRDQSPSQWALDCTREHPKFQIMVRNLFWVLWQNQDPNPLKNSDSQPWLHIRITEGAFEKLDDRFYPIGSTPD